MIGVGQIPITMTIVMLLQKIDPNIQNDEQAENENVTVGDQSLLIVVEIIVGTLEIVDLLIVHHIVLIHAHIPEIEVHPLIDLNIEEIANHLVVKTIEVIQEIELISHLNDITIRITIPALRRREIGMVGEEAKALIPAKMILNGEVAIDQKVQTKFVLQTM